MGVDVIITIIGSVLSALASGMPTVYRAIVPDGRTPEQVIADARKAVDAIPVAPASTAIDAVIASRKPAA